FFFSSRRRHTRLQGDWSSDVCSSDLRALERLELLDAKLSRAVLRGRDAGNIILLPDTDVQDAEWIANLLQHGLLTASYVPSQEQIGRASCRERGVELGGRRMIKRK